MISDKQVQKRTQKALALLERHGSTFTRSALALQLAKEDRRFDSTLKYIFTAAYFSELSGGWGQKITLAEAFGAGNFSEEDGQRKVGSSYAIDASHTRRYTRHMTPAELKFVADRLVQQSAQSKQEAQALYLAAGAVGARGFSVTHHVTTVEKSIIREKAPSRPAGRRGRKPGSHRPSSGFRGVYWHVSAGKFVVILTVDKKPRYLGLFSDPREAALAYDEAVIKHRGSDAVTNAKLGYLN